MSDISDYLAEVEGCLHPVLPDESEEDRAGRLAACDQCHGASDIPRLVALCREQAKQIRRHRASLAGIEKHNECIPGHHAEPCAKCDAHYGLEAETDEDIPPGYFKLLVEQEVTDG